MAVQKKRFQTKSFTSLVSLWSFLLLFLSGFVLYIRPEGDLAKQLDWRWLWIDKAGWEGAHTILSAVFIVFVILHIYFNWRPLLTYFAAKLANGLNHRRELVVSVILILFIFAAAVAQWQPFRQLIDLRRYLKYEWRASQMTPGEPQAFMPSVTPGQPGGRAEMYENT